MKFQVIKSYRASDKNKSFFQRPENLIKSSRRGRNTNMMLLEEL